MNDKNDTKDESAQEVTSLQNDLSPEELYRIKTLVLMEEALWRLRETRPSEGSGLDEHYDVVITDLRNVCAYFEKFVANDGVSNYYNFDCGVT